MRLSRALFVLTFAVVPACGSGEEGASTGSGLGSEDDGGDGVDGAPKGPGSACTSDDQCEGVCATGVCSVPTTSDGKRSPSLGETDVDCGGDSAPACAEGKSCAGDDDCSTKVCGASKKCVSARSCGGTNGPAGMVTCGQGEPGEASAVHESCCKSLPLPKTKSRRLDKYEITAGRIRTFIDALAKENGGTANVRAFAKAYAEANPSSELGDVARRYPGLFDILPETKDPDAPMPLQVHLGAFPIDAMNTYDGCFVGPGAEGHATYWQEAADIAPYGIGDGKGVRKFGKEVLDAKSINCVMPLFLATFCAWDGGELARTTDYDEVWGANTATITAGKILIPWTRMLSIGEFNFRNGSRNVTCDKIGVEGWPGCVDNQPYHYQFPSPTTSDDDTPTIGAPGRFPLDVTQAKSGNGEGWYDIGGNMLEAAWQKTGTLQYPKDGRADFVCDMTVSPPPPGNPNRCDRKVGQQIRSGVKRFKSRVPLVLLMGYSFEVHARYGEAYLRTGDESEANGYPVSFQYGKASGRCARPAP